MNVPIVHMITDLSTGGSQNALSRFLSRIDRGRFRPTVVCLKNGDTAIAEEIRSMNIPVVDLRMVHPGRIGALWRLYAFLDDARPAIIHAWLFHAVLLARLVGRMAAVPIVISSRRNINLGSPLREVVNRMTMGYDDRVIAVSHAARRVDIERGGASPEKVIAIHNGVDPGVYRPATPETRHGVRRLFGLVPEARLVGTVGRLHPSKGVDDFLKAAARVVVQSPGTRFLIIGDGNEREALERLSVDMGLEEAVSFLGERTDVPLLLQGLDLFVLSSREEGMPNAILEAMASGVPVVATSAGGTGEIVDHGSTGLLVAPGDVDGLAAAILSVLETPASAAVMAENARRQVAASFSIEATVKQTEKLYEELLREKLDLS